jgi:hypothetical protein
MAFFAKGEGTAAIHMANGKPHVIIFNCGATEKFPQ